VGLVAPTKNLSGAYIVANHRFGPEELDAIKAYGADLIRFQVSQGGLDLDSPIYRPEYLETLVRGVRMARSKGFIVILSMQSQKPSGLDDPRGLPNDSTARAWRRLAPLFTADDGIIFELFNEPSNARDQPGSAEPTWAQWLAAHQPLLDQVRQEGARNALIVDGLRYAQTLKDAPPLADPMSNVIYAVHPYPLAKLSSSHDWDEAFGRFAERHPVLITEWNAQPVRSCSDDLSAFATDLLAYARAHHIGVVGWAFDLPGTLLRSDGSPTSYSGFSCSGVRVGVGAGAALHGYFAD
jgi:hypothetical protein